ncbi:uncharacterized protein LOC144151893 [Haemaphysalis longicornis]
MAPINVVPLVVMAVVVSAEYLRSDPSCDFSDLVPEAAVSRLLAKIPEELEVGGQRFRAIVPGLEIGGTQLRNLNRLRQFGPAIPYCVNGSRLLQVDFITKVPVFLTAPWRTCSGKEGQIRLLAGVVRFTAQFDIVESGAGSANSPLRLREIGPAATEEISVITIGAGSVIETVTVVLGKIFDGLLREAWNTAFFPTIREALTMA